MLWENSIWQLSNGHIMHGPFSAKFQGIFYFKYMIHVAQGLKRFFVIGGAES
jgi:hypothetical protein